MLKFAVFVRTPSRCSLLPELTLEIMFRSFTLSKIRPCKQSSWLHTGPAEIQSADIHFLTFTLIGQRHRPTAIGPTVPVGTRAQGPRVGSDCMLIAEPGEGPQGGLRAAACATTSALPHLPTTCPWRPTWLLALLLLGCLGRRGRLGREPSLLVDLRLLEQRLEVFLDLAGVVEDADGGARGHALFEARV